MIKVLNDNDIDQIRELYKTGEYTQRQLASMYYVDIKVINQALKDNYQSKKKVKLSNEIIDEMYEMVEDGYSNREISRKMNLSESVVSQYTRGKNHFKKRPERQNEKQVDLHLNEATSEMIKAKEIFNKVKQDDVIDITTYMGRLLLHGKVIQKSKHLIFLKTKLGIEAIGYVDILTKDKLPRKVG